MKGLIYQLKNVGKDKFCIMTFLLPIVAAIGLNVVGTLDFSSVNVLDFGVVAHDNRAETQAWLEDYGVVATYPTKADLVAAVNDPSTDLIGVETAGNGIKTIVSGDETAVVQQVANTLPVLYQQGKAGAVDVQVLAQPDVMDVYQKFFVAILLIMAMFMGCTFNAVNIISEKEEGIAFINNILPMTAGEYMIQKIFVGFVFGCLSSIITVILCLQLSLREMVLMAALIVMSAFISAMLGLIIGKVSDGLMVGVSYIKVVMLVFLAVPIGNYFVDGDNNVLAKLCYLVPSSATFEGIMDLANGYSETMEKVLGVLALHCVIWGIFYLVLSRRQKKRRSVW